MEKMQKTYYIWGIIVVLIFALLTVFGFVYKNKTNVYKELENKLVEAQKKYIDNKFLYPEDDKEFKVKAETLIENGFLDNLNIENDECSGYASIKKNGMVYEYFGYVSCKNYKTRGFSL